MTEQLLLDALLLFAFALAPRQANGTLTSTVHARLHVVAFIAAVVAVVGIGGAAVVWLAFCVFGAASYVRRLGRDVLTLVGVAGGVPFAFSVVSAVWFVAAKNDLGLLGYAEAYSSYAALHGAVLGWWFVGSVAVLARRRASPLWAGCCLVAFALFVCVAIGIDGVPALKVVGVVGLSVLVPGVIARHAVDLAAARGPAWWWSLLSLAGVVVSMGLALANEFWPRFPRVLGGLPTMVVVHGVLNAVVVVPAFARAVGVGHRHRAAPPT